MWSVAYIGESNRMFMSSGHWQNTGLARWVNKNLYHYNANNEKSMNPMRWHLLQNDGDVNSIRETINGFPCRLILVNDGTTSLNEGQQEPTPGNTKDMGIFNFNNDKDNVNTLGLDTDIFPNCISYEVTANSDTSAGAFVPFVTSGYSMSYWINGSGTSYKYSSPLIPISFLTDTLELTRVQCVVNNGGFRYTQLNSSMSQLGQKTINGGSLETDFIEGVAFIRVETQQLECDMTMNNIPIIFTTERTTQNVEETPMALDNELEYLQNSFELRYPDEDDVGGDYGYLGMNSNVNFINYNANFGLPWTGFMELSYFRTNTLTLSLGNAGTRETFNVDGYNNNNEKVQSETISTSGGTITLNSDVTKIQIYIIVSDWTYIEINGTKYYKGSNSNVDKNNPSSINNPYIEEGFSSDYGLKRVIDWVGNATREQFLADFDKYFNKEYVLRYYLLVITLGMVDKRNVHLKSTLINGESPEMDNAQEENLLTI